MLSTSNLARSRYVGLTLLVINRAEHNNKRSLNCNHRMKKNLSSFLLIHTSFGFEIRIVRQTNDEPTKIEPLFSVLNQRMEKLTKIGPF